MTIEEQKKMVAEDKANAKSDKIISILFVVAFLSAPIAVIGYNTYDYIKEKHEAKIKQQNKEDFEKSKTLKASLYFRNNAKIK